MIAIALALDPRAHRYGIDRPLPASFQQWQPACRYERTGTRTEAEVESSITEAQDFVDALVSAMWADGLLETIPE